MRRARNLLRKLRKIRKRFFQKNLKKLICRFLLRVIKLRKRRNLSKTISKQVNFFIKFLAEIRVKDKKFALIDFVLTKFELNFLKSVSEEEIKELERNNLFNKKLFFKEFLNFNTNFVKFSVTMTDRKNLYVDANVSNISLFDYDYTLKVNQFLEEEKNFCVNKEFRVKLLLKI